MSTKEKILSTALAMFNHNGYQNVGVREIARKLNISPGNLSYHYSKKEDVLFNLLSQLREANNRLYENYNKEEASLKNFLILIKGIFQSQYNFRGIFIGNQFVQQEIKTLDRFNYRQMAKKRVALFKEMFIKLADNKEVKTTEADINFLVSFMTLFGRFWIMEAFLTEDKRNKDEVIDHYLQMLQKQLSLICN